nr:MAG TPA: hypothetical protein [Caudoviricetes sp.]
MLTLHFMYYVMFLVVHGLCKCNAIKLAKL